MDSERLWALMNQQLDGQNGRAEEEELREELERSNRARTQMEELRRLSRILEPMKDVESPEGLGASVLKVVSAKVGSARPPSALGLASRLGISRAWLYPLAAGLLVGLLVGNSWKGHSVPGLEIESLYGTIGSGSQWRPVARETMGSERVEVSRFGSQILVQIEVQSQEPVELEFHWDPELLGLKGLSCPSACRVTGVVDTVSLHPSGSGRHSVLFEFPGASTGSLQLHLRRSGLLSHQSAWTFENGAGSASG